MSPQINSNWANRHRADLGSPPTHRVPRLHSAKLDKNLPNAESQLTPHPLLSTKYCEVCEVAYLFTDRQQAPHVT